MSLHVASRGAGADLVLLHGWGMHGGVWEGVVDKLSESFRVHVVDLPGHGESVDIAPYSLERVAEAVAAAVPSRAHWCGWSLGGLVALEAAQHFPEQVARLVLVASTPCFAKRDDWSCAVAPEILGEFADSLMGDYEGTLKRFLSLQVRGDEAAKAVLRDLRDSLFTRGRPAEQALRGGLEILAGSDLRDRAAGVAQHSLVIHGERDQLVPLPAGEWLARNLPVAKLAVVKGAAHAPFLSHPDEFVSMVNNFLAGNG